jgi:hypothetical protein
VNNTLLPIFKYADVSVLQMKEVPFMNVGAVVGSGNEHFTFKLKILGYRL